VKEWDKECLLWTEHFFCETFKQEYVFVRPEQGKITKKCCDQVNLPHHSQQLLRKIQLASGIILAVEAQVDFQSVFIYYEQLV